MQAIPSNDRIETQHGAFEERMKALRGNKTLDSTTLDGGRICHSHIRPYQGLESKAPAMSLNCRPPSEEVGIIHQEGYRRESLMSSVNMLSLGIL
jgi:hypothetical protein